MKVDYLIVGQGLAGSLLAWQLLERGQRVLVIDRDEPDTCSKVAAGIVSPITGSRIAPSWRINEFLPFAHQFYWKIEEQLGEKFFHHTRIARLFREEKQQVRWEKLRVEQAENITPYVSDDPFQVDNAVFHNDLGGFEMSQAGWLDVPAFLRATQLHLLERLGFAIGKLNAEDVNVDHEGLKWKNIEAKSIIFAQGWEGNRNRFFDFMPMNGTKGEILEIECDDVAASAETRIVNREGWVLPLGNGKFRIGSNYDREFKNAGPTEAGKQAVTERVSQFFKPDFSVTDHRAAIRPVIRQSRAVIGRHPEFVRVAFFNGLGSKGVMNGPFIANQLAEHLVYGEPIDDDLDLRKNY